MVVMYVYDCCGTFSFDNDGSGNHPFIGMHFNDGTKSFNHDLGSSCTRKDGEGARETAELGGGRIQRRELVWVERFAEQGGDEGSGR